MIATGCQQNELVINHYQGTGLAQIVKFAATENCTGKMPMPLNTRKWPAIVFICFLAWWLWPAPTGKVKRTLPPGWQHFCPGDQIRAMICSGPDLWIGGLSGLQRFDWQTLANTTSQISSAPVPLARIEAMIQAADQTIWIGHDRGLLSLEKTGQWQDHTSSLPDPKVLSLGISAQKELWVGTWRGAAVLQGDGTWKHIKVADGLPAEKVRTIFTDSAGGLWLGTSSPPGGGLVRWSDSPKIHYTTADLLAHPSVTAMFEDSSGRIWIGTGFFDQGGVTCFPDWKNNNLATARILRQKDGLAGNKGRSIYEDRNGIIWIGAEIDGLTRIERNGSFSVITRDNGLIGDEVMCMTEDPDGNLWLGQERGLCRIASHALTIMNAAAARSEKTPEND